MATAGGVSAADLELAYSHCQRITKENARNFYYSSWLMPPAKRRAMCAVYAYCRLCDDIADGELPLDKKYLGFEEVRQNLRASELSGKDAQIYRALRDAAQNFRIPHSYFEEILQGVEMDMVKDRFASFDELQEYCYKVASVVGLVCIQVFGYKDPKAKEYAIDLGLAMQLTNILRDVKEDVERGRIYIPQDEMAQFNYTEDELRKGALTDEFKALMAYQAARARGYFDSGRRLFPLISSDTRACLMLMHATYSGILNRIERSGFDVFERRIGLSAGAKLVLLTRIWASRFLPTFSGKG